MSISGDSPSFAGIELLTNVFVDSFGHISKVKTNLRLNSVLQVVDGSIGQVLHLIGHPLKSVHHLLIDDVLRSSPEVNQWIKGLPQRKVSSHLVLENERLFGVIIDAKNETRIAGIVCQTLSQSMSERISDRFVNSVFYLDFAESEEKNKTQSFYELKDKTFIISLIKRGAIVGIVAKGGHLFLDTNVWNADQQMPELVLILQNGLFIIENSELVWMLSDWAISGKTLETRLEPEEFIVSINGGCVRNGLKYELYGSRNAFIRFEHFERFCDKISSEEFSRHLSSNSKTNQEINEEIIGKMSEDFYNHCLVSDQSLNDFSEDEDYYEKDSIS